MSMPLSSMEGYLFSRLDGVMNVEELCAAVGLSLDELTIILEKLSGLGAIDVQEAPKEPPRAPPRARPRAAKQLKQPPKDEDEEEKEGDLSLEMRREVMGMRLHIDQANFYQMLGVPPKSDRGTLRKAYFDLSRKYHPDSYFGKDLGRYRPMMELIFAKLSEAYETLSRKKRREMYDEYIADQIEADEMERRLAGETAPAPAPEEGEGAALMLYQFETVPVGQVQTAPGQKGVVVAPTPEEQPKDAAVKTKFQPKYSDQVIKMAEALVPREAVEPRTPGKDKVVIPKGQTPKRIPQAPSTASPASPTTPRTPTPPQPSPARAPSAPQAPPRAAPARSAPATAPPSQPTSPIGAESESLKKLRQKRGRSALKSLLRKGKPPPMPKHLQQQNEEEDPLEEYGIVLTLDRPLPGASPEELLTYQFIGAAIDALKLKDTPKAVSLLERVTELDPGNEEVEYALEKVRTKATGSLVSSYVRQGNYEEHTGNHRQAAESFLKALQYRNDDHKLMVKVASNMAKGDGDLKKARGLARRAIGLRPEIGEYRLALAEIYLKLGMETEALEELEVAHRLDPDNERVIRMLRGIEGQK